MKPSRILSILLPLGLALAAASLSSCISLTRTEVEAYTITEYDTLRTTGVHNAPGERDNGNIFPSSKSSSIEGHQLMHDSIHNRYYPSFLRIGVLELAGLVGTGGQDSYWGGLFGAYGHLDSNVGTRGKHWTFGGGAIRVAPNEQRLRWFRDAENWTFGTYLFEMWIPEGDLSAQRIIYGKTISGIFPMYFRKRFFLREEAPYFMIEPTVGVGLFPWQYVNLGATASVGSYGGLNFRAYLGYIGGAQSLIKTSGTQATPISNFPYFGLGISVLDFVNTVKETQTEWKDHKNHAIQIQALGIDVVHALGTVTSLFAPDPKPGDATPFLTGINLRFATMNYPLWPVDKHVFVGTTLYTIMVHGIEIAGASVLPLRAGYHAVLVADDLTNETFAEYHYYPSSYVNLENRLTLDLSAIFPRLSLNLNLGYVSGSTGSVYGLSILSKAAHTSDFSGAYISGGIGISDGLFNPSSLVP